MDCGPLIFEGAGAAVLLTYGFSPSVDAEGGAAVPVTAPSERSGAGTDRSAGSDSDVVVVVRCRRWVVVVSADVVVEEVSDSSSVGSDDSVVTSGGGGGGGEDFAALVSAFRPTSLPTLISTSGKVTLGLPLSALW